MRALSVGVDHGWLGSQAFQGASAFNANIGAWNTASVTTLFAVCAALSARAARHRGRDALG
jgi:surface protein